MLGSLDSFNHIDFGVGHLSASKCPMPLFLYRRGIACLADDYRNVLEMQNQVRLRTYNADVSSHTG